MLGRIDCSKEYKPPRIDRKDRKLLSLLAEDGRKPIKDLARDLRLSRDAISYRMRRLENAGIIRGYAPIIDLSLFGYNTYHMFFLLAEKAGKAGLRKALASHPNTRSIMEYSDSWDLEWTVVARSLKEFDAIQTGIVTHYENAIVRHKSMAVTKGFNSINLPYAFYEGIKPRFLWKKQGPEPKLDAKDAAILAELSTNARQSTYALSQKVRVSPDTVGYRIKNLLKTGVIRSFTLIPNLSALGLDLHALALEFKSLTAPEEVRFGQFCRDNAFMLRAVKTFGPWDALVHIATPDAQSYHALLKDMKKVFAGSIQKCQTWRGFKESQFSYFPNVIARKSASTASRFLKGA